MSRYIDADLLMEEFKEAQKVREKIKGEFVQSFLSEGMLCTEWWWVENIVNQIPTADVIEVVRCKDCEWWEKQKDSLQGRCDLMQMYPTGEWFCGNAQERRTDECID